MVDTTLRVSGISQFFSFSAHESSPISPPCLQSVISVSLEIPQKSAEFLEYFLIVTERALKNKNASFHLILAFSCVFGSNKQEIHGHICLPNTSGVR